MAFEQRTNGEIRELALFAGAGGGILGGKLLGWKTVAAVEIIPFCARRLMQRQNEGHLPPFPIWDDVCTFDGRDWNGLVDVVSGGFPCQDISSAGKGAGVDGGARSGLWKQFIRIIGDVRPSFALIENSPRLVDKGLDIVLDDLAVCGYDAEWTVLGAGDCGASHERERIWILAADTSVLRCSGLIGRPSEAKRCAAGLLERNGGMGAPTIFPRSEEELVSPRIVGTSNGLANRVDRTRAVGNGQVPAVVATACTILANRLLQQREAAAAVGSSSAE